MIGAIFGDVVGSVYEFNNIRKKDFKLFCDKSKFTDDTVLTVAIAESILHMENNSPRKCYANHIKAYYRRYPGAGFGKAGEGYIRISAFNSRANVLEAIERLRKAL